MKRLQLLAVPLIALAAALVVSGCSSRSTSGAGRSASGGLVLNGAGATFPYPVYSKWFEAYHQARPNVTINYQAVGSGAGIAQYKAGTVDFGASDAPLTDAEIAQMPRPVIHIPTVAGAVVLAYNVPGIGAGLRLSGDVIADIFLGKIAAWNDPRLQSQNPSVKLPTTPIAVAHRADGSGTTHLFTSYLSAVSPDWKTRVGAGKSVSWPVGTGGNGNAGVAGLVSHSPGTIGYVELAYALETKLTFGPVRNRSGNYVQASTESTTAAAADAADRIKADVRAAIVDAPGAQSYPIAGFTYLLVPKHPTDPTKGKALTDLLTWAMGPGQQLAAALQYAPLPPAVVAMNKQSIDGMEAVAAR